MSQSRSVPSAPKNETLTAEHLAHFETPKTWNEIVLLEPRLSLHQWRRGIIAADDYGSGLLTWLPDEPPRSRDRNEGRRPAGAWVLTDRGRAHVARARIRATQSPIEPEATCPEV